MDLFENDILAVVEELRQKGRILVAFNSTFVAFILKKDMGISFEDCLAFILKKDKGISFEDYHPISLWNIIYKITTKIIANRICGILSNDISQEQHAFLKGKLIHDATGTTQEVLHSAKINKSPLVTLKIDLCRAYDQVLPLVNSFID